MQADRFDRDGKAFGSGHQSEFQAQRNRIGGVLLVPGWVNLRVRDGQYTEKRSVAVSSLRRYHPPGVFRAKRGDDVNPSAAYGVAPRTVP